MFVHTYTKCVVWNVHTNNTRAYVNMHNKWVSFRLTIASGKKYVYMYVCAYIQIVCRDGHLSSVCVAFVFFFFCTHFKCLMSNTICIRTPIHTVRTYQSLCRNEIIINRISPVCNCRVHRTRFYMFTQNARRSFREIIMVWLTCHTSGRFEWMLQTTHNFRYERMQI